MRRLATCEPYHSSPMPASRVRRATPGDSEGIRRIYNAAVLTTTATLDLVPRDAGEQRAWMAEHSGVYPVLVEGEGEEVWGFSCLSAYRPRPGYATVVEDSVYVDEARRGQGIGRSLLEAAVEAARTHGFHSVIGRVITEQEASMALHRACGFDVVGIEREVGRKFGRWLDVALLQRML